MSGMDPARREREQLPRDALPMLDHLADFPAMERTVSPPIVRSIAGKSAR